MVKNALSVTINAIIPARPRDGNTQGSGIAGGAMVPAIASIVSGSALLILPIRVLGMFDVPQRPAAVNRRDICEIIFRRWRSSCPFEGPRVPRVLACGLAAHERANDVKQQRAYPEGLKDHSN